jgi:hypothetical protein
VAHQDFWEVIKDDSRKTFEVIRQSFDDTHLTKLTCEMQEYGLPVRCETIPATKPRQDIPLGYRQIGYTEESGLYDRLVNDLRKAKRERDRGGTSKA